MKSWNTMGFTTSFHKNMYVICWEYWGSQTYFNIRNVSGWWLNQPVWKICSSNWESSPDRVENKNIWVATTQFWYPPPKAKSSPQKLVSIPTGNFIEPNHPFSGAFAVSFREGNPSPMFNSSTLKNGGKRKRILSYWVSVTLQGRAVNVLLDVTFLGWWVKTWLEIKDLGNLL